MKYLPGNSQHIGSRQEQQDSFGFSDPDDSEFAGHGGFLAVLADGAGGMDHGGAASTAAVKTFLASYATKMASEEIPAALEQSLVRANAAVHDLAKREVAEDNVATTLVAAVFFHDQLHWISVGDSALYFYRGGSLSLLTISHNYGRELDRRAAVGHISAEAALSHPDRKALTSFVGLKLLNEVDRSLKPLILQGGDKVLLASDGLFNALSDNEIAEELLLEPQAACDALIQKVLSRNLSHQDNVTVLCIGAEADEETSVYPPQDEPARGDRKKIWFGWRR
jgi:protein phosphatase